MGQSPDSVLMLTKEGFRVVVESGAGANASFSDEAYEAAGATMVDGNDAWKADIVVKVIQGASNCGVCDWSKRHYRS